MPRPLTVADRPPQVGDILTNPGKPHHLCKIENYVTGPEWACELFVPPAEYRRRYVYVRRADGGPVTLEEQ